MGSVRTSTAIVLAAGMGVRLSSVHDAPKGFIDIDGRPIIERSLELLATVGVRDVLFVTGWQADIYDSFLRERFRHVRTVRNEAYETTGSLRSLACAAPHVDGDALILESDLVYEVRALSTLLEHPDRDVVLVSGPTQSDDEVWVYAGSDGYLSQMVKDRLPASLIAGELVGLIRLSNKLLRKIAAAADDLPATSRYEEGFNAVCHEYPISLLCLNPLAWCEIDTPEHLVRARGQVWPQIVAADAPSNAA
jgi:2-aminoethylphosphonate-pyruvate transaminase